jgi:carbon monoxide dehydrogenase subunit G
MAETIEKKFELDAPIELVWIFVTDPQHVVACLPGAAITGKLDARTYAGTISIKVGLVAAGYTGKATFQRIDAAKHEVEIVGEGRDVKGKGSAEMRMICRLTAIGPEKTHVAVSSDVTITGLLAQMGRGMIQTVSDQMLKQFTSQFAQKLIEARKKYAEIVKTHAVGFLKAFAGKLEELNSLSGLRVTPDGSNSAASPADIMKYVEAVKQIGGGMAYTSARIILRGAAQKERIPFPEF